MPSVRVTVSLNTNQTLKTPLLIPAGFSINSSEPISAHSFVVKTAAAKLRLKKVQRIFVARGGKELLTEEDRKIALKNDAILLVSAGEDYVGSKREAGRYTDHVNLNCPIVNLAQNAVVDTQAISQLEQTAHTLPGLIHAVGQPDLHPGNRFPIGAVFVSDGWIHPPLIGGDIGCGMAWYRVTSLSRRQVDGDKGKKIADNLRGLEGPWSSQGSIGAGNHFAELQVVESSSTDELKEDEVVLLVHSGSRGYGGDVLKKHASDEDPSFQANSPKANAYMEEHEKACEWAKGNSSTASHDHIQDLRAKINARKVVDIWHNNVERIAWPPSPPTSESLEGATTSLVLDDREKTEPSFAYVHRKGAAPTYNPDTKTPLSILPLPGSRGIPTLILRPKFSQETNWGVHNALSLAHGAGRAMSRAKAFASFGQKFRDADTQLVPTAASQATLSADGRDVHGGTWVICDQKDLVWKESPGAYKDVFAVADELEREGFAKVVGWLRARVSYKIRHE